MSASRSKNPGYTHGKVDGMTLYKLHVTHLTGITYLAILLLSQRSQWRFVQKALYTFDGGREALGDLRD